MRARLRSAESRGAGGVRSSKASVAASPGNVYVVPAGPVAFTSTVNVSPTVTSALLAVAVTATGAGAAATGGGVAAA
jgi:hypothetical protein